MKSYPEHFAKLVQSLQQLPTIGKKSAIRLAYFLAFEDKIAALQIAHHIENCVQKLTKCDLCCGISGNPICEICEDASRQNGQLCILAHPKEIFLLEESGEFCGRYFIIQSIETLDLKLLKKRIEQEQIKEIIFALSPSLSNDSLMIFLEDKLQSFKLQFTKIAQGIPTGVSLENVDQLSIIRSFQARTKV